MATTEPHSQPRERGRISPDGSPWSREAPAGSVRRSATRSPSRRDGRGRLLLEPRAGRRARQSVEAAGGTLTLHQGNIGDAEDCQRVVEEVIDEHGRLDILVNNAGITVDKPVWKLSVDDWDKVLKVDLSERSTCPSRRSST